MMREFHRVDATFNSFNAALDSELFLFLVETINNYLPVVRPRGKQVTVSYVCSAQNPRIILVETLQAENWLFFVHDPQVHCIIRGCSHEKLVVYDVYCISKMAEIVIQQFCILIDFPKNALSVQAARQHSVLGVAV